MRSNVLEVFEVCKQFDRVPGSVGNGYGFPSSHSQNMGYFATFLILHLHFRHTFAPSGSWIVDKAIRVFAYFVIVSWAGVVAYSRYGFFSWVTLVLY